MAQRSWAQKLGSLGHRWAMAEIEKHPAWIARSLDEDFGVDAEAELADANVRGEILKLQFRSSLHVVRKSGKVRFDIDYKHIEYARTCRYPVVFVRIDVSAATAWYLWTQEWLLNRRTTDLPGVAPGTRAIAWVDEGHTLAAGLDHELKLIAQWRGETQLVLSLLDSLRAAAATHNADTMRLLVAVFSTVVPHMADMSLDVILAEAVLLGNALFGTPEGNAISDQLFSLVRQFGPRVSVTTVMMMVGRGDSYSRTGLVALGILYDEHFAHMISLQLPVAFQKAALPHVAYYCALREAYPERNFWHFIDGPGDFAYAGLRFDCPKDVYFGNKYANRGPSAILDYLVPTRE